MPEYLFSSNNTKDLKIDKEVLIQRQYPASDVIDFVKKHYTTSTYHEVLTGKDNLYLVMPSTSGRNVIPEYIAARLQKEYGGTIIVDHSLPLHKTKSAYMGAISKMKEPREYQMRKEAFEGIVLTGKNIIIVDDVVTTGNSISSLSRSLENNGIKVDCIVSLAQSDKRLVSGRDIERLSEKLLPVNGKLETVRKDVELLFTGKLKHAINTVEREVTGPKKIKYKEYAYEYITREAARIRSEASMDRGLQSGQEGETALYPRGNDRDPGVATGEKQSPHGRYSKNNMVGESVADLQRVAREQGYVMNANVITAVSEEMSSGRSTYEELKLAMMVKIDELEAAKTDNNSIKLVSGYEFHL